MVKKLTTAAALLSASLLSTTAIAGHHDEGEHAKGYDKEMSHDKKDYNHGKYDTHKKYLKRLDTDKDGAITLAEFMTAAEKRFNKMDKNGDGLINNDDRKHK